MASPDAPAPGISPVPAASLPRLTPIGFNDVVGWSGFQAGPALAAFRASAPALLAGTPETGRLGSGPARFAGAAAAVLAQPSEPSPGAARGFFERWFRPMRVEAEGFLTGYYEPLVEASLTRTPRFGVPLYAPPADLVRVEAEGEPGTPAASTFRRRLPDGSLADYPDRAAIEAGALAGRGLEIAWLADPVDAFFIHVQGSARMVLGDGRTVRVGYAAKNGHRFTAIGRVLVAEGRLALEEADMAGLRRWLAAHPLERRALLERNRSFIFFRLLPDEAPGDGVPAGPIGAAGVPLTAMGSLAVDRTLHTFGTPAIVEAPGLAVDGAPFRRLLVAQDTGSAILGAARGDLFTGSGEAAGALAGRIRDRARFTLLHPRDGAGP